MPTKSERFIAEFERDFAERSQFHKPVGTPGSMNGVTTLFPHGVGLDIDVESGIVRPSVTVTRITDPDQKHIKLHENYKIYDPEFDREGELIEMLMDSLKLPEPVIRERLKRAGLLGDDNGQT